MDDIERRLDAYIENNLQDADRQALRDWLAADNAHIRRFIRECFLHWQLFAIGRRKLMQRDVAETPRRKGIAGLAPGTALLHGKATVYDTSARDYTRLGVFAGIAASLAVISIFGFWLVMRLGEPQPVAQLTQTTADAAWANAAAAPAAGTFLNGGQSMNLAQGRALVTLSSGVKVVMQGRATIRIDDGNKIFLQAGRITVTVPRQASGFSIDSPLGRFVDLGTEFTLDLQPDSGCELYVFSGLVELQPANDMAAERVRVPEGRAIGFDRVSGAVKTLHYADSERMTL